jgi:HEAT repeat protein
MVAMAAEDRLNVRDPAFPARPRRPLRWRELNRSTPTIPALVAGTREGISFVRSLAAWHLGRLGPRHPGIEAAVPELHELLNDNDPSAGAEALVVLGNLAGKGAPPPELKFLLAHR